MPFCEGTGFRGCAGVPRHAMLSCSGGERGAAVAKATVVPDDEAETLLAPCGGVEAASAGGDRLRANCGYPDAHREELTRAYPDERVVIVHRRAATHADSPEEAVRTAREAGEPPNGALVRHPPAERRAWLP